jgi:hypothetical protein
MRKAADAGWFRQLAGDYYYGAWCDPQAAAGDGAKRGRRLADRSAAPGTGTRTAKDEQCRARRAVEEDPDRQAVDKFKQDLGQRLLADRLADPLFEGRLHRGTVDGSGSVDWRP